MAVKVKFIRRNTQEIENLPVADGQLLYDYQSGSIYMDYGNTRVTLSPNIITSVNGKTGEVTIDLNNLNAEEKGVAQALLTTHLDSYDHTKLNIIKTNGSNEKFLNQEGNYVEVSAIGSTRWENDGIDKIKPKNEKKVSVDNIDKAMSKEVYDELEVEEQLVGVTATQTLSNKTLVAPLIKNHAQYFLTDTDFGKKELIEEDDNDGARFVTEITDDNWDNKKTAISIDTSGKIGIGKKNPEYKLDVDGDVNIPAGSNYKIDGVDIGTGGGGLEWIEKDENYTIKSGEGVLADTSADTWTLTLPATPTSGDFIGVSDSNSTFNTNNLTIARNSSKIMGEEEDLVVDLKDASFQLIYTGSATGWKLDTNLSMPEEDPIDIGYKSLVSNVMDMTANRGGRFAQTQASNTTYTASSSSGDVWILKINCTGDSTATFTSMTIVGGTTSNTLSCVSGNVYSIIFENYNSTITGRVI